MIGERFSAYRIMWLFVLFDLPTETKVDRKRASRFRKQLLQGGFTMLQYSVYIRHCPSFENLSVHKRRVHNILPPKGQVSMMHITDKQYGQIENFWSARIGNLPDAPQQIEMF